MLGNRDPDLLEIFKAAVKAELHRDMLTLNREFVFMPRESDQAESSVEHHTSLIYWTENTMFKSVIFTYTTPKQKPNWGSTDSSSNT